MSQFKYDFTPEEIRKVIVRWIFRFGFAFLSAWIVQISWSYSISPIFGLRELTYLQAFAFYVLSRAFLGWPELSRSVHRLWMREMNIRDRAFLTQLFIQYVGQPKPVEEQTNTGSSEESTPANQSEDSAPGASAGGQRSGQGPRESSH